MKTLSVMFVVLGIVFGPGCMFQRITEADLLGKYQADIPDGGTEILDLLPNGECVQEIFFPGGINYKIRGTWRYLPESKYLQFRGIRAVLTPTRKLNPNLANGPSAEVIATPVSRGLIGNITIMLHEGIDYRKLKPLIGTRAE